jgi:hypothetical protein
MAPWRAGEIASVLGRSSSRESRWPRGELVRLQVSPGAGRSAAAGREVPTLEDERGTVAAGPELAACRVVITGAVAQQAMSQVARDAVRQALGKPGTNSTTSPLWTRELGNETGLLILWLGAEELFSARRGAVTPKRVSSARRRRTSYSPAAQPATSSAVPRRDRSARSSAFSRKQASWRRTPPTDPETRKFREQVCPHPSVRTRFARTRGPLERGRDGRLSPTRRGARRASRRGAR